VRHDETRGEFEVAGEAVLADVRGALCLADQRIMIVSDLHLEKGAAKARRGRLLPPYDTATTLALLERSLRLFEPQTVICLGDSFDDAGGSGAMPEIYRAELARLMAGARLVLDRGQSRSRPAAGAWAATRCARWRSAG
jgi:uncharacterized protein